LSAKQLEDSYISESHSNLRLGTTPSLISLMGYEELGVPLDVPEAIRKRRSIRKYRSEPIPNEKLQLILEAARLAPSSDNRQPLRFIVIKKTSSKKAPAQATQLPIHCRRQCYCCSSWRPASFA